MHDAQLFTPAMTGQAGNECGRKASAAVILVALLNALSALGHVGNRAAGLAHGHSQGLAKVAEVCVARIFTQPEYTVVLSVL